MIKTVALAAALALAAGIASAAAKDAGPPYTMDAKLNRCVDAKHNMVATSKCAAPAAAAGKAAPNCKKGKPCGNTCIAKDKECHIK